MQRSQQLYGRFRKNLKDKLVYHNSYERARLVRMKKMESDLDRLCLLELRCIDLNCSNNVNVLRTEEHLFRKLKKARVDRWMEERVGQHYRQAVDGGDSGEADRDAPANATSTPTSPQPHLARRPAPHRLRFHSETQEAQPAGTSQQRQQQSERRDQKRTTVLPEHFRKHPGVVEDDQALSATEATAAAASASAGQDDSSYQLERANASGTDGGSTPNAIRHAAASRAVSSETSQPLLLPATDASANGSDRLPPIVSPQQKKDLSGRDGGGESRRTPLHLHRPQLHRSVVYSKYWGRLVYSSEERGALFHDVRRQRLRMLDAERAELTHFVFAFARKIAGVGDEAASLEPRA